MEQRLFDTLLYAWIGLAAAVFVLLFFISAPYGRHGRKGWGPQLDRTIGWVVMELPAVLSMVLFFAMGQRTTSLVAIVFLVLWQLHYVNRALVFPFRLRGGNKRMPLLVVLFAICFNLGNAYFNGRYLFALAPEYPVAWLLDPRFLAGALLFLVGYAINLHSDQVLLRMRAESAGSDYGIPRGGAFELVSCPNYLGELLEWSGWALATWSLAGLSFALWTAANLVPRARTHHRWYRQRFADYPARRRAVIPYLF
jgi:protein-S-isoprenylcysteine O-methyltransferase Ste14